MQNSTFKMHKYILGWLGLMIAFGVTLPIAMLRVSASPKFANQPFNSETCVSHKPATRTVTSWLETCSRMSITSHPAATGLVRSVSLTAWIALISTAEPSNPSLLSASATSPVSASQP